jgi:hypothetical protein
MGFFFISFFDYWPGGCDDNRSPTDAELADLRSEKFCVVAGSFVKSHAV